MARLKGQGVDPRLSKLPPPVEGARWLPLTQGKFALVDEEDFARLNQYAWSYGPKGAAHRGETIGGRQRKFLLHREVMKAPDHLQVDHRDLNRLNNRKENLRLATNRQNHANRPAQRNNTTGFKGVTKTKTAYLARICVNQKSIHLGSFRDPIEAACAYNVAATRHFGEFARLNRMD